MDGDTIAYYNRVISTKVDELNQQSIPLEKRDTYGITIISLILLGAIAAKTGGSSITKAVIRITFWGTAAMGLTALVGYLFNVSIG